MKKKLLIAILGAISILFAGFSTVGYNVHNETQEFNAFRKELDKELLKETSKYISIIEAITIIVFPMYPLLESTLIVSFPILYLSSKYTCTIL